MSSAGVSTSLRHLVSIGDFSRDEVKAIFALTKEIKDNLKASQAKGVLPRHRLPGDVLAMIFEKPSLRTRCTFETGMVQLGGHAIYLQPSDIGMGTRESVKDVAQSLGRWVQAIMARTFKQTTVEELAKWAGVPVVNGLSELEHPCQVLADFYTVLEHRGSLDGFHLAWISDGFNVCNSLLLLSAILGTKLTMAIPEGYDPPKRIWDQARKINKDTDKLIRLVRDPKEAVRSADAVYTDIYASMGLEAEKEKRLRDFAPFQLNKALMKHAPKGCWIMHDMPAHRDEEITDEMMESPNAIILDQAENRLHAQKGVLCFLRGR